MHGQIASLYRYPVKGFTPERLGRVKLREGEYFPVDRLYAVENGPSGFDPAAPAFVSKTKFTVLARMAEVARVRTGYDEATTRFAVSGDGHTDLTADLSSEAGRTALAAWLTAFLGEAATGPLKVVSAPPHRFTDHILGHVSIINLASLRDLGQRMAVLIDPLRFRANLYIEGWPAWAELDLGAGTPVTLGGASLSVFKPITRCIATHVDPASGVRDLEIVEALHTHYGHLHCGLYLHVTGGGIVKEGDGATA